MGWLNSDGLYVEFGTAEATPGIGGETNISGDLRELVFDIDLATLTTSAVIISDNFWLPKNARIDSVVVEVITAAEGATADLNVGLMKTDRTTAYDADGLVKAADVATIDGAGKKLTLITGATAAGDSIGTTLTENALVTADYDTAAFTAGEVRVRVYYFFM